MKTLDGAVIELRGVLPEIGYARKSDSGYYIHEGRISCNGVILGSVEQFQKRAKDLGFKA